MLHVHLYKTENGYFRGLYNGPGGFGRNVL